MPTGTVKWFDPRQGFGYITPDDGGPEVFIHTSIVQASGLDTLTEAQTVAYEVQVNRKGPRAVSVTAAGPPTDERLA